jgi:hypothetical protein
MPLKRGFMYVPDSCDDQRWNAFTSGMYVCTETRVVCESVYAFISPIYVCTETRVIDRRGHRTRYAYVFETHVCTEARTTGALVCLRVQYSCMYRGRTRWGPWYWWIAQAAKKEGPATRKGP